MSGWIGVDLDGTLAEYDGWKGFDHIGKPIEPMVSRVQGWLAEGKEVKIFTARACGYESIALIRKWCLDNIGTALEATNVKDFYMIELWDDRCVQVIPNTGIAVGKEGG